MPATSATRTPKAGDFPLARLTRSATDGPDRSYCKYPPSSGTGDIATDYRTCALEYGKFDLYLESLGTIPKGSLEVSAVSRRRESGEQLTEYPRTIPSTVISAMRLISETSTDEANSIEVSTDFERWTRCVKRLGRYISPGLLHPDTISSLESLTAHNGSSVSIAGETSAQNEVEEAHVQRLRTAKTCSTADIESAAALVLDWIEVEDTKQRDKLDEDMMRKSNSVGEVLDGYWAP